MSTRLSPTQQETIARYVPVFRRYLDDAENDSNLLEQQARRELYSQLLTPDALKHMGELEFGQVISSLWSSRLWGNKGYLVEKLIRDNTLPALVDELRRLLWGRGAVGTRFDAFRRAVKGMGAASITELLAFVHPERCGLWNDMARAALDVLGFREDFPTLRKAQISGDEYESFNDLLTAIQSELGAHRIDDLDFLGVNYFLFAVWENARERLPLSERVPPPPPEAPEEDFDHDEMVEHLVNIGQWLGFQAEKEKMVARGSRVDVLWQAQIGNLGVVSYVFEVQRRGSIDSLILNLQRAQNNPTVQRLIIVAAAENIDHIKGEIASLPESFRKSVGFMEVREALRAAELIGELSGIIGKLELVRSQFGV
ncbi:hypothetical protein ARNL5_02840 [Anaerolineae bacterium]|nr:hypothetical protein [Anaerolinea sp.]MCC6975093.1 hypothetical protein [Anaerolineae bacterium]CAG0985933.1 hypothetical protein ARNL5_02840 [Anaerolineae bacterium]